jgi:hypothetical protein
MKGNRKPNGAAIANLLSTPSPRRRIDPERVWPQVLEDIASGASLTAALQRLRPSPSYWWAKDQLRRNPELRARYKEACEDRADRLAEELLELSDCPIPPDLDGPGRSAFVQQLRLRVDARKWIAAKLRPRAYGERLDVSVQETRISITAVLAEAEERVRRDLAERRQEGSALLVTPTSD